MWNVLNDASRNTCNNMWVQIWTSCSDTCFANALVSKLWTYNSLQVQERVSLMFLHQVLPQCVFIICYLTSQHMTISLRPSLYIENGGREGLEQGLAMQFNFWMKTNVWEKEKTCLENIFGLVSSLMPRPPCPCEEHLMVWFKFLVTSHVRQMHNYCAKNAISSACCLIVV